MNKISADVIKNFPQMCWVLCKPVTDKIYRGT